MHLVRMIDLLNTSSLKANIQRILGIPATGKTVTIPGVILVVIKNGKIALEQDFIQSRIYEPTRNYSKKIKKAITVLF